MHYSPPPPVAPCKACIAIDRQSDHASQAECYNLAVFATTYYGAVFTCDAANTNTLRACTTTPSAVTALAIRNTFVSQPNAALLAFQQFNLVCYGNGISDAIFVDCGCFQPFTYSVCTTTSGGIGK